MKIAKDVPLMTVCLTLIFHGMGITSTSPMQVYNVVTDFQADNSGTSPTQDRIQDAINTAIADGGGYVYLPKGVYKITGTINILAEGNRKCVNIFGDATMTSQIYIDPNISEITGLEITGEQSSFVNISNIQIRSGEWSRKHVGLKIRQAEQGVNVTNVYIAQMKTALYLSGHTNVFNNIRIDTCLTGIQIGDGSDPINEWCNSNSFYGGFVQGCQDYGIRFAWGRGNVIHGMNIQFNGGKGISFDDTQSDDGYGNRIEGCYFEANGNANNPFFYIGSRNNTIIANTIIKHTGSSAQIFEWKQNTFNGGPANDWKSGNYIIGNTILDNTDMINGPFIRKDVFLSKVGIGTATPVRQLTINHPDDPTLGLYTNNTERVTLRTDVGSNFKVETQGSEKLRVTGDGKVGIGTTSPGAKLEVNGKVKIDSTSNAPMNLPIFTTEPTNPSVGDIWILKSGTVYKVRLRVSSTATKTITFTN